MVGVADYGERLAALEADVDNLKGWQKRQNGHLEAIDNKLDGVMKWLLGIAGGIIVSLALLLIDIVLRWRGGA